MKYTDLKEHFEKNGDSGGQGNGEDISEAECMYRYLLNKGIEPEDCRLLRNEFDCNIR